MDADLVTRALSGEKAAFAEIVGQYQNKVFSVAKGVLGSREDALDVAQETFLRAYRKLPTLRGENLSAWLCRIATNIALDLLRKQKNQVLWEEFDFQPAPATENPDAVLLASEQSTALSRAVESLPPAYRSMIVLRHVAELSYQEIADQLELPLSQVKNRLLRARRSCGNNWPKTTGRCSNGMQGLSSSD